ncbi:hypothetical protein [Cupriavidus pauculus]|uniref:hypothetical protein n=1 Tax=Cupriavidus pauculus TaxID=82633 RepID=UPI0007841C4D|nr:hypothetical protein [Cupriavidus pauculus]
MKLVVESSADPQADAEMGAVLVSLIRLGFLRSCRRLTGGGYLIEVDDPLMEEFSTAGSCFRALKVSAWQ